MTVDCVYEKGIYDLLIVGIYVFVVSTLTIDKDSVKPGLFLMN
jgi:hypothetical protein